MITKEKEEKYKNQQRNKILIFLIYGSTITIGVLLIWLYSAYIFINKWNWIKIEFFLIRLFYLLKISTKPHNYMVKNMYY